MPESFSAPVSGRKFPYATALISLAVVAFYFYLSGGSLFISDERLSAFSLSPGGSPLGVVAHLFAHVGPRHLASNVLPLLAFGYVFEMSVGWLEAFFVFLASGAIAGGVFSLLNPAVALVGASTGVAGLIGGSCLSAPKSAFVLLLFTPLFVYFILLPSADLASGGQAAALEKKSGGLADLYAAQVAQNRPKEAQQTAQEISAVEQSRLALSKGIEREGKSSSDALVHVVGALVGMAFVILFRRSAADKGVAELEETIGSLGRALGL
ncbi:rhomboid family intramembrane serine protease [Candidatus Micrarchaeota archaeon]|nr:rhomboid family intramembrane serine protease [Candidatus Micrarchaeota archaeon]